VAREKRRLHFTVEICYKISDRRVVIGIMFELNKLPVAYRSTSRNCKCVVPADRLHVYLILYVVYVLYASVQP